MFYKYLIENFKYYQIHVNIMDEKKVRLIISTLINDAAAEVAAYVFNNPDTTEFEIERDLGYTIKDIRTLFYEIEGYTLINRENRKNKELNQYYYHWNLDLNKFVQVFKTEISKRLKNLNKELDDEKNLQWFMCPNCIQRNHYEDCLEFDFECPNCQSLMNEDDNSRRIKRLEKTKEKLEKVYNSVN